MQLETAIFLLKVLGAVLLLPAAVLVAIYISDKRAERLRRLRELQPAPRPTPIEKLDAAIADWLLVLELPQFEEQTRREEAARQLSTLLIERLMLRKCPDRPSTTDLQD